MSQSVTPWYLDKALYVTVLSLILPVISAKLGIQLDPVKVAGMMVLAATYVAGHKWKSGKVLVAEIEQAAHTAIAQRLGPTAPAASP